MTLKPPGLPSDPIPQGASVYDVRDFGARGDVDSNTAGIVAATAQARTDGGGIVWLPFAEYEVDTSSSAAFSLGADDPIVLTGVGPGVTNQTGTIITSVSGSNPLVKILGTGTTAGTRGSGGVVGVSLNGDGRAITLCHLERAQELTFDRVRIINSTGTGLLLRQVWNTTFGPVQVASCGNGTTSPAILVDGISGESASDTLHFTSLQTEGCLGTDLKLTGSTSSANPSQKIKISAWKTEGSNNRSFPVLDLENVSDLGVSNWGVLLLHASNTSKIIQGGSLAANTLDAVEFSNLHFASSGSPTDYIVCSGGNRFLFDNLYCTGAPSNKYVKIDSALSAVAVRVRGYVPASQALACDDQRSSCNLMAGVLRAPIEKISAGASLAEYGSGIMGWDLSASSFGIVAGNLQVPYDCASGLSPTVRATWATADTSGNVRLTGELKLLRPASSDASAAVSGETKTVAVAGVANQVTATSFAPGLAVQPGDTLAVRFYRDGGHAADTAASTMRLLSVDVVYERQL